MRKFIIVFLILFIQGCTVSLSDSYNALESAGFKNIQLGSYDIFTCGHDDNFSRKFTATNVNGRKVSGTLCKGFLKGTTIRY